MRQILTRSAKKGTVDTIQTSSPCSSPSIKCVKRLIIKTKSAQIKSKNKSNGIEKAKLF